MKHIFPFVIILIAIFVYACANQGTPSGGPRDTIPPLLLESNPTDKTINFDGKEFSFEFNERINADKLKQKLIITPFTENPYKFKVKKNDLYIEFEEKFEDNTTYTFNFADGVVDVTEKNPVENFSIAFSTGPFLDSISISGRITNLYTNKNIDKATIAVYSIKDTLDILTGKPRYFAQTDTSGTYRIENIKNGYYKIYAFEDANNNLKCEPDEESHGFIQDSVNLNTSQENLDIKIQLLNITPLKMVRSKKTGQYFDVLYNKYIENYKIKKADSTNQLDIPINNIIKGRTTLRFYYDSLYTYDTDSLQLIISAQDTVYNQIQDTVYIQFSESKRKPEKLNSSLLPTDKSNIDPTFNMTFSFTKPITQFTIDSITYQYDTLYKYTFVDSVATWNENRTELTLINTLDKYFLQQQVDSLRNTLIDTTQLVSDSIALDSITQFKVNYLNKIKTEQVYMNFPHGTFITIDQDTVEQFTRFYSFKDSENFGKVSGQVTTQVPQYILQLVNDKYKVISELQNAKTFTFSYIKPGKYTFRILIDDNQDGAWEHGSMLQNQQEESIYFYPELFDIRANWEIENIEITF
ncbi:Ig-like domain-containing protein [Reichenbachiella agariperforans]|uniref:Ig-like domain-containing protein n=1 Tax=Reichenbachiella agariperforans TaxID=156994 RepID=UPI001C090FBA|nr:Ig-like domain-containing protein [Reichenbachiella agariperforans]MBU2914655.1 Ig-like domain-containing protein [Reichenbachiella agariperforans]